VLDEHIDVSFSVHPEIRQIRFHDPDSLSLEEYFLDFYYSPSILMKDTGESFVDFLRQNTRQMVQLEPGEHAEFALTVDAGYLVTTPRLLVTAVAKDGSSPSEEQLTFRLKTDHFTPEKPEIAAGPYRVNLYNDSNAPQKVFMHFTPGVEYFDYVPFLSGAQLLNNTLFRRLYPTQVVKSSEGITIKDVTFMFTDLKNSTDLYSRIGDLHAFDLVTRHFEKLSHIIDRHHGTIVKTMGDAVMASFTVPADAVAAALEMRTPLDEFKTSDTPSDIALKIGIHRGASILVNSNKGLDYFGQTVNIASRVQGLAKGNEVCLSDDVYNAPNVSEQLKGHDVDVVENVPLKGVSQTMNVYRVMSSVEP
jgi:class 3 adenylate cyclase